MGYEETLLKNLVADGLGMTALPLAVPGEGQEGELPVPLSSVLIL